MPKRISKEKDDVAETKKVEVFRPGTFTAMNGEEVEFTADDLREIVDVYDPEKHPAPSVVGHPKTDDPAWAWVKNFEYDDEKDRLVAVVGDVIPEFGEAVSKGMYKKVSMSFHAPESAANPMPGKFYPKHLGFLGAKAPAVSGLTPVQFEDGGEELVFVNGSAAEFGEPAFRDIAGLFRKMREWLIAEKDLETADQLLPDWEINWISRAADRDDEANNFANRQEDHMSGKDDAAFAERETALNEREEKIKKDLELVASVRHDSNVSFADSLVAQGKLPKDSQAATVALLDSLSGDVEAVSFGEGDGKVEKSPADLLKDVLSAQPVMVSFAEVDLEEAPEADGDDSQSIAFAATKYQNEQREAGLEVSISDAVAHVTKGKQS